MPEYKPFQVPSTAKFIESWKAGTPTDELWNDLSSQEAENQS
jgi:hypothetical protein